MNSPTLLAAAILLPFLRGGWTEPAQDVQDLVQQLRSEKADVRSEARRKLKEAGRSAQPMLERATRDADPDVASTAKELLRILPMMEKLSPALRTAIPGVEERLVLGGREEWTNAFLEALAYDRNTSLRLNPDVRRADLEFLVGPALQGADPGQAQKICRILMGNPLRSAVPELVKLLGSSSCSQLVVAALSGLPFPDTLEAVLPLLKDKSIEARMRAAETLGGLHLPEGGPPLIALLSDPNDQVKAAAIRALGALRCRDAGPELRKCLRLERHRTWSLEALGKVGCKEAVGDIAPYLDAKDQMVRGYAAMALGELGAEETAPRIAKLLIPKPNNQEKYGVALALEALGRLGAKDALPLIRPYADDPSVELRCRAICALATLEDRESAARIVPSLAESDIGVSGAARHALRQFKATEQVPLIVAQIQKDPTRSGVAVSTLGDLRARDAVPAILPLLESNMAHERAVAADALCRLGSDQGTRILLEHRDIWPNLMSLNALRRPEAWAKLEEGVLRESSEGLPVQILESVARQLGLKLDASPHFLQEVLPSQSLCNSYLTVPFFWGRPQPLDLLEWVTALTVSEVILESDRLRWISRDEGRAFWKTWLSERTKPGKPQ